jgi:MTH538 TIR-like domain (DUF1863)
MADGGKRYRSFISYSQQDRAWGRRLQSWLETYRVPVGVIAEVQGGQRLGRFFRDEAEMPAASDIGEVVREAIETAESLIVVCSPRSAQSKWVSSEIAHFRKTNPNGKLLAVIIDGVANSGDPRTECFPAALRREVAGEEAMPVEPVGVDVRVDSKERICARLAAGLLDVDFEDLWQRDRRRAERRDRRAMAVLAALTAIFAGLACAALWFANSAQQQTRAAETARLALQTEYLAVLGESAMEQVLTSDLEPGVLESVDAGDWISLMRNESDDFILARQFKRGRLFAVAHDGALDAARIKHGDAFLRRSMSWLKGPDGRAEVVVASGHCEWMALTTEDWALPDLLREWGYSVRDAPGVLNDEVLANAGVLVIGNAWTSFQPAETAAIERFAERGGGVLMAGLGWSWLDNANDPKLACPGAPLPPNPVTLADYPMNVLGARFGVRWAEK